LCRYSPSLGTISVNPSRAIPVAEGDTDMSTAPTPSARALRALPPVEYPAGTDLAGTRVMVVDDDARSIFALSAFLKRFHVDVLSAERGTRGVELLEQTPRVGLALVDIAMPGMDGYATMRAMRGLPSVGAIPLVALTARVAPGERQRCIDASASGYISKPVLWAC
jgi:CheY-like chemotaxis protein